MSNKVRFVGPFYGTKELNKFIDEVNSDDSVFDVLMDGYINTAFVQFSDGHLRRIAYELIEDAYERYSLF